MCNGQHKKAMDALEKAVMHLNAPQCVLKLADVYFECAKYEDAIESPL